MFNDKTNPKTVIVDGIEIEPISRHVCPQCGAVDNVYYKHLKSNNSIQARCDGCNKFIKNVKHDHRPQEEIQAEKIQEWQNKMRKKLNSNLSSFSVMLKVSLYEDHGNIYVGMIDTDNALPFCNITVNTCVKLPPFFAAIKDYSENAGMVDILIENDLGELTGESLSIGYVTVPVFKFNRDRLFIFDPKGVVNYEAELAKRM